MNTPAKPDEGLSSCPFCHLPAEYQHRRIDGATQTRIGCFRYNECRVWPHTAWQDREHAEMDWMPKPSRDEGRG